MRGSTRFGLVALAGLLAALALVLPASGGAADGSVSVRCVNLRISSHVKRALRAAHRKVDRTATGPRRGSTYYGRCGSTRYALAWFRNRRLGYQDQPEVFRRRAGGRWRDLGDTGGPNGACGRVPRALMRIWGFRC